MIYNNNTLLLSKRDWLRIGSLAKWAQQGTAPLSENQERIRRCFKNLERKFGQLAPTRRSLGSFDEGEELCDIPQLKLTEEDKQYFLDRLWQMIYKYLEDFDNFEFLVVIFDYLDGYNLLDDLTKKEIIKTLYGNMQKKIKNHIFGTSQLAKKRVLPSSIEALLNLGQNDPNNEIVSINVKRDLVLRTLLLSFPHTDREIIDLINCFINLPLWQQEQLITPMIKEELKTQLKGRLSLWSVVIFIWGHADQFTNLTKLMVNLNKSPWGKEMNTFITEYIRNFLNTKIEEKGSFEKILTGTSKLFDNFSGTIEEELNEVIMLPLAKHLNELSKGEYASFHNACKKISRKFSDKIVRYCEEKNYRRLANSLTIMRDHIEIDEKDGYNNNTLLLSKEDWLRISSLAKWDLAVK